MSIPNIRKVYCLQDSSKLSPLRRNESILHDVNLSRSSLPKTSFLNESSETKHNSLSHRADIKKDRIILPLPKPIRSTSVLDVRENIQIVSRVTSMNTEIERETLAERREKQQKKFAMWKKVTEIKAALYSLQSQNKQKIFPRKICVKKVIECLETMNESDSHLSDLMSMIVATLKAAIYISPEIIEQYAKAFSFLNSEELRRLLKCSKTVGAPYYSLVKIVTKELNRESHFVYQELEKAFLEKRNEVEELESELRGRLSEQEQNELLTELNWLRRYVKSLEENNKQLKDQNEQLTTQNTALQKDIFKNVDEIEALSWKIGDLEIERDNLKKDLQKESGKLRELHDIVKLFKEFKDKSILKLGLVKQQIHDFRKENERLVNENRLLSARAGSGFQDLTPRPDYQKIQETMEIEAKMFRKSGSPRYCPTSYIVEEMANKIQVLSQRLSGTEKGAKLEQRKPGVRKIVRKEASNSESPEKAKNKEIDKRRVPSLTERKKTNKTQIIKKDKTAEPGRRGCLQSISVVTNTLEDDERISGLSTKITSGISPNSEVGNISRKEVGVGSSIGLNYEIKIEKLYTEEPHQQKEEVAEPADEILTFFVEAAKGIEKSHNRLTNISD